MGSKTKIEWADATWNPVRGCKKVSPGCANCYAERLAERFRGTPGHPFEQGFDVRLVPKLLEQPLQWKPKRIFVCSMSDLFNEEVPFSFVDQVMYWITRAYWHRFMILTKRPLVMRYYFEQKKHPQNLWLGVSVEDRKRLARIEELAKITTRWTGEESLGKQRFLSIEPLLEDLGEIDLTRISWVIVGGESGPNARPMQANWVRSIRDQCLAAGVPFFFKQWGPRNLEPILDGETWRQFPTGLILEGAVS